MKRKLVISDIHGCYDAWLRLLELVDYDKERDQLLILGDYVDRGPNSREVLEHLIYLRDVHGAVVLRGNHDQRLIDLVQHADEKVIGKFLDHGGAATARSYLNLSANGEDDVTAQTIKEMISVIRNEHAHHIAFLNSLPYYAEDSHHIYVHAGLNPDYPDWKKQPLQDFLTIKEPFISQPTVALKTVVFGHTQAKAIHGSPDVWFGEGKIGIDGFVLSECSLICSKLIGRVDTGPIKRAFTFK
ncbi:metallophosphoesterase family protein [Paenibacillus nasutitermitis]|uniref:Serine/threonine protein phosphatase n=1 Tax=Paenibacillus nasutitermitis TaxID=1652958 RepID=A0A916YQ58_9BACL|nr:metallophosphoesterase family protein [Paenibacillus nasutitermitis]GGD55907.1 serine/threonine protein phosphatase [Paenibacillus nasutitermitis]